MKPTHYYSCEAKWRYFDYSALEGGESSQTKQKQFSGVEITFLQIISCGFYASRKSGCLYCCVDDAVICSHLLLKMLKAIPVS